MTKEIEAAVRAINRTCRGPRRKTIDPQDWNAMNEALQNALADVGTPPDGPDPAGYLIGELLHRGAKTEAHALDEVLRLPCGTDFNHLILAGPLDGETHAYTCPQCGVSGVYRAPNFLPES